MDTPVLDQPAAGLDGSDGPRRRWPVVVAAVALLGAVGMVVVLGSAAGTDGPGSASALIGRPVPPVVGETMDGETFDLADHAGEFVVVNFFATWCVPCLVEHPELIRFSERHAETGDASVVSVVFQDDPEAVARFFETNGGDWPVLSSSTGRTALEFGVTGVPESYVVAPDGTVVARFISGVRADELEAAMAAWEPAS